MATLLHFTHLPHPLWETTENKEFKCDGCERIGIGKRYQCKECNFNLHVHCGQCPIDLLSFVHLKHHLHLTLIQRSVSAFSRKPACEVCGVSVGGLFYQCKRCDLYVHPLCTQLPRYVHHTTDHKHFLELQQLEQCPCTVCGGQCSGWYYRCIACPVSVHIDCVMEMFASSVNDSTEKKRSVLRIRRARMMHLWMGCMSFVLILFLLRLIMGYRTSDTYDVQITSN